VAQAWMSGLRVDAGAACGAGVDVVAVRGADWGAGAARGAGVDVGAARGKGRGAEATCGLQGTYNRRGVGWSNDVNRRTRREEGLQVVGRCAGGGKGEG
jgi:hypothetical protein